MKESEVLFFTVSLRQYIFFSFPGLFHDELLLENELVTISAIPSHSVAFTAFSSAQPELRSGLTELRMACEHFFSVFSSAENLVDLSTA